MTSSSSDKGRHPHLPWPRTIFTLPNDDVYDSPGSVMVAFDQAVVPGMDGRTVELVKPFGLSDGASGCDKT